MALSLCIGKRALGWSRSLGAILMFSIPARLAFFVLHYDPTTEKAEWLDGHMSGTNVVIWDLEPLVGGGESLPFRWVENVGDGEKAVTILIVDMQIYWPVCAKAATVETWKELAGPVPE